MKAKARLVALGSLVALALAAQAPTLQAADSFEGIWAETQAECLDDEGANSRTLIDFGGKYTPMFDQYEHHCRIEQRSVVADGIELKVTCFEFWEQFTKGIEGQKATIKLSPGAGSTIKIDGKPFRRCGPKKR